MDGESTQAQENTTEQTTQTEKTAGSAGNEENKQEQQEQKEKTFKQEDVNKIVSDRLSREKSKWEADYKQKLEDEKAEAEKLAKMTAAEKQKHLLDKKDKELAEKEKTIASREMKLTKIDIFSEKKLPIKLVDCIQGNTAEEVKTNIDTFEKEWHAAIDEAVTEKLKGKSPYNAGNDNKDTGKTIAEERNKRNSKNPYANFWAQK